MRVYIAPPQIKRPWRTLSNVLEEEIKEGETPESDHKDGVGKSSSAVLPESEARRNTRKAGATTGADEE